MMSALAPAIIGTAHSSFAKMPDVSLETLISDAAAAAIADAKIDPADIDEIYLGHFNGGFSEQSFTGSLVQEAHSELRFKPTTRVENACATGSAAVHQAVKTIGSGASRAVLVVGAERMSQVPSTEVARNLLRAAYLPEHGGLPGGFAGIFGLIADAYFQRYGPQDDALAAIAVKNHANGAGNPLAQIRKVLDFDFCRTVSAANPIVAGPLKRTDCSPISDGAAALVLVCDEIAFGASKAVTLRAASHVQDYLPFSRRDVVALEGARIAWRQALERSRLTLADLDLVETHDCFTIAELIEYEAMGLAEPGRGAQAILEGWTHRDGRLPVNPSGGLKAKGHPIGATGVSMHVLAARQLIGDAPGETQINGATIAGLFNMGGAGVANYVSILERAR